MEEKALEQLGLNRHEAKIYLILIKAGTLTAVSIAKRSGLHRRTVYDSLESLQRKGLVHKRMRKHVQNFSPSNPQSLLGLLEDKKNSLKEILPFLIAEYSSIKEKREIEIFEGIEGMKVVFNDLIKEAEKKKSEAVMIGAGLKAPDYMKYSFPHYVRALDRINWRLIEPDLPRIREDVKQWKIKDVKNLRYLPSKYLAPLSLASYQDKFIIMLLEGEPILIKITGKTYALAFRNYFELLWNAAK